MTFKRARSPENKEKRMKEIKQAALQLFYKEHYSDITLASISKELNFTRANLYKYYRTKEEIYLDAVIDEINLWKNDIIKHIDIIPDNNPRAFAAMWAEETTIHINLIRLFTLLFGVIERNVGLENLVDFKKKLLVTNTQLIERINKYFENLTSTQIADFLTYHISLSIGLYPMCHPSDRQLEAMTISGFKMSTLDFESYLANAIEIYIQSLL